MLIKTKGIVLKSIKYGETSLIVDVFTLELGLRTYIVNGVRKKKARFGASLFQHTSFIDLVAYEKKGRNIHRIKEVQSAYTYQTLPYDVKKSAVGLFMTEIIQKVLQGEEEHPELFDFLYESYVYLDQTEASIANIPIQFLLSLTTFLGIQPEDNYDKDHPFFNLMEGYFQQEPPVLHVHYLKPSESLILSQSIKHPLTESHLLKIKPSERKPLLENILLFYRLHINSFPDIHSHLILEGVFKE